MRWMTDPVFAKRDRVVDVCARYAEAMTEAASPASIVI
jgi:hypothetical protein